uniref:SWIM-type domain-containing protein n=1 Tax=Plectus sambesii TaxID=2011161 RepID=A0A914XQQ5_9BILA
MYKQRKRTNLTRRISEDHSRGYYLTQCRDLIKEKAAGREWVVQSSDGYCGKQYTVTREIAEPCATTCCTQCSECPHQYTCTCPRYIQDDVMSCKHTHAINEMVFSEQFVIVKEEEIETEVVGAPEQEAQEAADQAPDYLQVVNFAQPEVEVVEADDDGYYPDFSEPVGFRRFQLRVKDPIQSSDLSPRFANLCFDGGLLEKKQVIVDDESYKDLLELMRCVFPCSSTTFQCKPVSIHNVALLSRLAHKYQIAQLRAHCETFLTTEFKCKRVEPGVLLNILIVVAKTRVSRKAIAAIIGRAATYDFQILNRARLAENLPAQIWSALLFVKQHYRPNQSTMLNERNGHRFELEYDGKPAGREEYCWHHGTMCWQSSCLNCSNSYCLDSNEDGEDDNDILLGTCHEPERVPLPSAHVDLALLDFLI